MIRISFFKTNKNLFNGIQCEGHISSQFGEKGNNLVCSAVSFLLQTVFLYFLKKNEIKEKEIQDGFLKFTLKDSKELANRQDFFELVIIGVNNLKEQYPNEIIIEGE